MCIKYPLPLPRRCVKSLITITYKTPTLQEILVDVCNVFGENIDIVTSKKRTNNIIRCRMVYCYVANVLTRESYKQIAKVVNYGDHTTYCNQMDTTTDCLSSNDEWFMKEWNKYVEDSKIWGKHFAVLSKKINNVVIGTYKPDGIKNKTQ